MTFSTAFYQALASAFVALAFVCSLYWGGQRVAIHRGWFEWMRLLPEKAQVWIRAFVLFEAMFLIGDLVLVLEPIVKRFLPFVLGALGLQGTQIGAGILVLVFGLCAYWFKVKNQLAYGVVEIGFSGWL
jgi:hypothetical protein